MAWSSDRILNIREDSLRDKVRKGLVGVSNLESGGPLMLKKTLDIVMDVDDSALRILTKAYTILQSEGRSWRECGYSGKLP